MRRLAVLGALSLAACSSWAGLPSGVGDPQLMTDHPWYQGELASSTFPRLFATQKAIYERDVGRRVDNDEDKALASWYWRNLVYYHESGPDAYEFGNTLSSTREYWTGLYSFGFALCGTTHAQWTAEMQQLLGHCRGRVMGVSGHNSFEVFLTGGTYGEGAWVLLDHDISSIVFDDLAAPKRLRSIWEIAYSTPPPQKTPRPAAERAAMLDMKGAPSVNRGWFTAGLLYNGPDKNGAFATFDAIRAVEPLAGYAGPPPTISLRRGETFRRYLRPGLGGDTYVYWGRNVREGDILGPSRGRTWANRPHTMFRAATNTPHTAGQARYGNGVFTYVPNFADGSYRDGVVAETDSSVTLYFYSPYVIATSPANNTEWAYREPGGTEGLIVTGRQPGCTLQISTDNQATWSDAVPLTGSIDLTDRAKGFQSYHLRFNAGARSLANKGIAIRTVVIANDRLMPRLKDNGSVVTYQASGRAVFAAGPNELQAKPFVTSGSFGSSNVVMTVPSPRGAPILEVHAAAWVASGNPPKPNVKYQIECSFDGGARWFPVVSDWQIRRPGGYGHEDVGGHWSQSFCYGSLDVSAAKASAVQVRFRNDGGNSYRKAEVYLVYRTANDCRNKVTFNWTDGGGTKTAENVLPQNQAKPVRWAIPTGNNTVTNWVQFETVPARW